MDIIIRPACSEDIPRMSSLLTELFTIESDFAPDAGKQERGLVLLVSDRSAASLVLVAVHEGTVIGMATVQTLVSTAEGGRVGLVEDVVVDRRFRCRNVGTRLIEGIIAWCTAQGHARLQLLADRDNHQALEFYSSRGWSSTRLICVRKML